MRHLVFPAPSHLIAVGAMLLACLASPLKAREVRTIYFASAGKPPAEAYLVGAKTSMAIELPQRNLSPEFSLPDGDLVLAAMHAPPAAGEAIPEGAPIVKIPADWTRCILVFLETDKNPVFPAIIIPINASAQKFPKGSTVVFNLSEATLGGKFGDEKIVVEPGKTRTFDAPIREFGSYPVALDCILKGEDKPRAVCRSTWQHDPEARQILFVVPQNGRPIPRIWGVFDYEWGQKAKPEHEGSN